MATAALPHSVGILTIIMIILSGVVSAAPSSENVRLTLLHTNDMHSRFAEIDLNNALCNAKTGTRDERECYGGFARLKTAADEAKKKARDAGRPVVFLNAGDTFQGTPYYSLLKWRVVADLIKYLGIDVMCLGNHEFDDGIENLVEYLKNVTIPIVTCNLNLTTEPELNQPILTPYKVLELGDGVKIGVVGYLTPETMALSSTQNLEILDEIQSLKMQVKILKSEGVDIIIALGHSGFDKDVEIAQKVPYVSLVVGGHTNTFLYSPMDKAPSIEKPLHEYPYMVTQEKTRRQVPVVQAFAYTKYLGRLDVTFAEDGSVVTASGNPILVDKTYEPDPNLAYHVNQWTVRIEAETKVEKGRTNVYLSGDESQCRLQECNLGNFVTDAYIDYTVDKYDLKAKGWTDAPIAIIQGGALRGSINNTKNHGIITLGDLLTFLPFRTPLMKVEMTGKTLKNVLEHGVARYDASKSRGAYGEFLQVSGLKVTYDVAKPPQHRVVSLEARCAKCDVPDYYPVEEGDVYTVIMTLFLENGGDGFKMIRQEEISARAVTDGDVHLTDTDVTAMLLEKSTVIYPGIEGRITILNKDKAVLSMLTASAAHFETKRISFYAVILCCLTIARNVF